MLTEPISPRSEAAPRADERLEIRSMRKVLDHRLDELVTPSASEPRALSDAVRYSLLAPGKRIRPILTLLTTSAFGGAERAALDPACALEMVHTASLILDDLPSMDDASLRRGQPANHLVHGEATATLAAVYLLNRAYGVLAEAPHLDSGARVRLSSILSRSIGGQGAVAGQYLDLDATKASDLDYLETVDSMKTASLFVAAVELGGVVAGVGSDELEALRRFGCSLGRAFQLRDDFVDAEESAEKAGKDVGQDENKATVYSSLGSDGARKTLAELTASTFAALRSLGPPGEALSTACRSVLPVE